MAGKLARRKAEKEERLAQKRRTFRTVPFLEETDLFQVNAAFEKFKALYEEAHGDTPSQGVFLRAMVVIGANEVNRAEDIELLFFGAWTGNSRVTR